MFKIVIDSGHGGKDSGAYANGMKEKDIVLDICKRIQAGLKDYENAQCIMTRTTDIFVPLEDRTKMANSMDADVLVSVHINAATNPAAKGFETYVYPGSNAGTIALQNVMHEEIMKQIKGLPGVEDRGKRQKNLHMLRESKMKAVLTESLFLSNAGDAKLLALDSFRQKVANGHINGLARFLGLKKAAQPPPETPETPAEKKLWVVQVGAFEEKKNAESLANDLMRQGYKPFIKYE